MCFHVFLHVLTKSLHIGTVPNYRHWLSPEASGSSRGGTQMLWLTGWTKHVRIFSILNEHGLNEKHGNTEMSNKNNSWFTRRMAIRIASPLRSSRSWEERQMDVAEVPLASVSCWLWPLRSSWSIYQPILVYPSMYLYLFTYLSTHLSFYPSICLSNLSNFNMV